MDAAEWNSKYPVGQRIAVHLVNGDTTHTWTKSEARRVGNNDMLEVVGFHGLVLLSWCEALPDGM